MSAPFKPFDQVDSGNCAHVGKTGYEPLSRTIAAGNVHKCVVLGRFEEELSKLGNRRFPGPR